MIREASIEDSSSIAEVIVESWQKAYDGIIKPEYPKTLEKEQFTRIFRNNIKDRKEIIFVYVEDQRIIGFISGKIIKEKYECQIVGLYVNSSYQGNGIGSKLLKKMKQYFYNEHCKELIVWTLEGARNNDFYLSREGIKKEKKKIKIGKYEYDGIAFKFVLGE